jgi:hypothetical protein
MLESRAHSLGFAWCDPSVQNRPPPPLIVDRPHPDLFDRVPAFSNLADYGVFSNGCLPAFEMLLWA